MNMITELRKKLESSHHSNLLESTYCEIFEAMEIITTSDVTNETHDANSIFSLITLTDLHMKQGASSIENVIQLWNNVPVLLKKFCENISSNTALKLSDVLDSYVDGGLNALVLTEISDNQLHNKLKIVSFFILRLCVTIQYLHHHLHNSKAQMKFYHHTSRYRGLLYLIGNNCANNSATNTHHFQNQIHSMLTRVSTTSRPNMMCYLSYVLNLIQETTRQVSSSNYAKSLVPDNNTLSTLSNDLLPCDIIGMIHLLCLEFQTQITNSNDAIIKESSISSANTCSSCTAGNGHNPSSAPPLISCTCTSTSTHIRNYCHISLHLLSLLSILYTTSGSAGNICYLKGDKHITDMIHMTSTSLTAIMPKEGKCIIVSVLVICVYMLTCRYATYCICYTY